MKDKIAAFVCSGDLEVQERSSSVLVLFECLKESPGLAEELMEAFEGELNPVAPKAQRKVIIIFICFRIILLLKIFLLKNTFVKKDILQILQVSIFSYLVYIEYNVEIGIIITFVSFIVVVKNVIKLFTYIILFSFRYQFQRTWI